MDQSSEPDKNGFSAASLFDILCRQLPDFFQGFSVFAVSPADEGGDCFSQGGITVEKACEIRRSDLEQFRLFNNETCRRARHACQKGHLTKNITRTKSKFHGKGFFSLIVYDTALDGPSRNDIAKIALVSLFEDGFPF